MSFPVSEPVEFWRDYGVVSVLFDNGLLSHRPLVECLVCSALVDGNSDSREAHEATHNGTRWRSVLVALEAVERKVGVDNSADRRSLDYRVAALERDR